MITSSAAFALTFHDAEFPRLASVLYTNCIENIHETEEILKMDDKDKQPT